MYPSMVTWLLRQISVFMPTLPQNYKLHSLPSSVILRAGMSCSLVNFVSLCSDSHVLCIMKFYTNTTNQAHILLLISQLLPSNGLWKKDYTLYQT